MISLNLELGTAFIGTSPIWCLPRSEKKVPLAVNRYLPLLITFYAPATCDVK
jgi:hypothetical protein